MDQEEASWRRNSSRSVRYSSYDQKLVAICLGAIAVISPLYIDRRKESDLETAEQPINFSSYWPLLLLILMVAIAVSGCRDRDFCWGGGDPNWIHRVGGSSIGIGIVLLILAVVLKCKSF